MLSELILRYGINNETPVVMLHVIIFIIIITYLLTYFLQFSFHSLAVALTPVQTKQVVYINETVQKHSTNKTKHSKYKYTYNQNIIFIKDK